jgi:hypothetical protein
MFQCPVVGVGLFFMGTSSTTGPSMAMALASAGRKAAAASMRMPVAP